MASSRDIKNRIKSIGNTKKITRAMELVSAAKMRKAIEAALKTRTYANLSWATVLNLAKAANGHDGRPLHPLLEQKNKLERVAVILITANRGLCGGFNSAIIKKAIESVKSHQSAGEFFLIGKKGAVVHKNFGYEVVADFPKLDFINEVSEVVPLAQMVIKDYLAGKYDKIMVAYTDYINAAKQLPRVKQFLPIDIKETGQSLGITGADSRLGLDQKFIVEKEKKYLQHDQFNYEYIFEPSPAEVLDEMLPRLLEIQLYQALLESNAAEHSARMSAMHQATEAAGDMVKELTLSYNKARQAGITAEIAEISAGANALA
ncbi:MAG: ATP synthase F1 subunit gamma [bacterium]|nr:ATP synthase F1 subunit gamma [bacterium]